MAHCGALVVRSHCQWFFPLTLLPSKHSPPPKKNPKNKSNTLNGAINRIQNFFKMNAKEWAIKATGITKSRSRWLLFKFFKNVKSCNNDIWKITCLSSLMLQIKIRNGFKLKVQDIIQKPEHLHSKKSEYLNLKVLFSS